MKILFFADLHASMKHGLYGISFVEQVSKTLSWIAQMVKETNADYVIFLGDVFHVQQAVDTPSIHAVVEGFQEIIDSCPNEVVIIEGNHDVYKKDGLWSSTSALRDLRGSLGNSPPVKIISKATTLELFNAAPGPSAIRVQCVPYTEKGYEVDHTADFICGHLEVSGAMYRPGGLVEESGVHAGFDDFMLERPGLDEPVNPVCYIGGHYHHPHIFGRTLIVGSCCYHSFSDKIVDTPRGAVLLNLERAGVPDIPDFSWLENPHATPVHTIEAQTHEQAEEQLKRLKDICHIPPENWHVRIKIPTVEAEHIDGRRVPRGVQYAVVPNDPPKVIARTQITSKTSPTDAFDEYARQAPPQKLKEAIVSEAHRILLAAQKEQDEAS
jgi:CxxC motif-containing protein